MASALKLNAPALKELEIIDEIINEPVHEKLLESDIFVQNLRDTLQRNLNEICEQDLEQLVGLRYQRLRKIGKFSA
jgi:acetyl-CoA carboxylase carboxyl transferase subunit alpha